MAKKKKSNWDASYEFGAHGFTKPIEDIVNFIPATQVDVDTKELLEAWRKSRTINLNDPTERHRQLEEMTRNPLDITRFIPAYNSKHKHALKDAVFLDTEYTEKGQILQASGFSAVLAKNNKGKYSFELTPNFNQFDRFYIPDDMEKWTLASGHVHGYDRKGLQILRGDAEYSTTFDRAEAARFLQQFSGQAQIGYNLLEADLPKIAGFYNDSEGFKLRAQNSWDYTVLDAMHLSKALFGDKAFYAGKLGLQRLAERYGVSAQQLGIQAHGSLADSVVTLKTLEGMINEFPEHPAVREFLGALNDTRSIHSHEWENKQGFELQQGHGFVTEPFRKSAARRATDYIANAIKGGVEYAVAIKDLVINGFGLGEAGYQQALEKNSDTIKMFEYNPHDLERSMEQENEEAIWKEIANLKKKSADAPVAGAGVSSQLNQLRKMVKTSLNDLGYADRSSSWANPAEILNIMGDTEVERAVTAAYRATHLGVLSHKDFTSADSSPAKTISAALANIQGEHQATQMDIYKQGQRLLDSNYASFRDTDFYRKLQDLAWNEIGNQDLRDFRLGVQQEKDRRKYEVQLYKEQQKKADAMRAAQQKARRERYKNLDRTDVSPYEWSDERLALQRSKHGLYNPGEDKFSKWAKQEGLDALFGYREEQQKKADAMRATQNAQAKEWESESARLDAESLQAHRDAFSKGLELRLNKQNVLDNAEYLTGFQRKRFADKTHDMVESLEEYQKAVQDTVKQNKLVTGTIKAMASAGRGLYNPQGYWNAQLQGISDVGGAVTGLLPSIFRPAGHRATTAIQQFLQADIAPKQNAWNQLANIGSMGMAAAGVLTAANPLAGGILAGASALVTLTSNFVGGHEQTKITEGTKLLAGRINLLSASFSALLAPLKLFHSGLRGAVGLYGRFANIMGIRYGIPYRDLTGISSTHYSAMLDSDSALGLKAGTLNAMHNNLALGQAGLYTSGQFDQNRLVAAARLGVFDTVYAPMGGDTQAQFASTVDRLSKRMAGADKRTKQEIMYFARQLDPSMPEVLERMALYREQGKYIGSFAGFQSGKAFSRVWQKHMTNAENADWEWTSAEFGAARHQTDMALKRIAAPLWSNIVLPIANAFNEALNKLPGVITPDGIDWSKVRDIGKQFWSKVTETLGISGKSPDDLLQSALNEARNFLGSALGETLKSGIWQALSWIHEKEMFLVDALKPAFSRLAEYINGIELDFEKDPNSILGFRPVITTPSEAYRRDRQSLDEAYSLAEKHRTESAGIGQTWQSWRTAPKRVQEGWEAALEGTGYQFTDETTKSDADFIATILKSVSNPYSKSKYLREELKADLDMMIQTGRLKQDKLLDNFIDETVKPMLELAPGAINNAKGAVQDINLNITDDSGKLSKAAQEQIGAAALAQMNMSVHGNTLTIGASYIKPSNSLL